MPRSFPTSAPPPAGLRPITRRAAWVCVHAEDRPAALARLKRALGEMIVDGIDTTMPLFHALLEEADIQTGQYNIHWLEKWLDRQG